MEKYCQELFALETESLRRCESCPGPAISWIESCFQIAELSWIDVKKKVTMQFNLSDAEKIRFLKFWRPKFKGTVEYYKFLYKAELFAPVTRNEAIEYWLRERATAIEFLNKHDQLFSYYKGGCSERDHEYFIAPHSEQSEAVHLMPKFYAQERIRDYACCRISALQNQMTE